MTPKLVYQHWEAIGYTYCFDAFWFNIYGRFYYQCPCFCKCSTIPSSHSLTMEQFLKIGNEKKKKKKPQLSLVARLVKQKLIIFWNY